MAMQQIIEVLTKAEADRKANKEASREANQDMLTRMAADKEDLLTKMKEDRKADQEELLARMDAMFEAYEKRMMATKEIETDPGMMQSAEEHQHVLSEDVAVMPVREPRKRRRVWKSTAG
jgi:predicted RecB family nuclease